MPLCRYSGHKLVTNQFLVSRGKTSFIRWRISDHSLVQDDHCGSTDLKVVSSVLHLIQLRITKTYLPTFQPSKQATFLLGYAHISPSSSPHPPMLVHEALTRYRSRVRIRPRSPKRSLTTLTRYGSAFKSPHASVPTSPNSQIPYILT